MSTQADLAKLLDDAHVALHGIEGLAVSERNRVEDGIQHARSAAASMVVDRPEPEAPVAVQEPPVAAPETPGGASDAREPSAGTGAQDAPASAKVKARAKN